MLVNFFLFILNNKHSIRKGFTYKGMVRYHINVDCDGNFARSSFNLACIVFGYADGFYLERGKNDN